MKKNLYYQQMFRRRNIIKEMLLSFFLMSCSIPRLILEVFIRKNFGERYFSFSTSILTSIVLFIAPAYKAYLSNKKYAISPYWGEKFSILNFLIHNLTWYLFIVAFVYVCHKRREEIKNLPSVFDFERFSLYTGDVDPQFSTYSYNGKTFDSRTVETKLEPAFCFVIGLVLFLFGQYVGALIMVCSIFYWLGYEGAYYQGDNFIMDKIDEMLMNQEMVASFVDNKDPKDTRGVSLYGRRPADPETRRRLAETFVQEQETAQAK